MKCHTQRCKAPVAYRVTRTHDNGLADHVFYTCAKREHQLGNRVPGWEPPTSPVTRPWRLMGFTGTHRVEPVTEGR